MSADLHSNISAISPDLLLKVTTFTLQTCKSTNFHFRWFRLFHKFTPYIIDVDQYFYWDAIFKLYPTKSNEWFTNPWYGYCIHLVVKLVIQGFRENHCVKSVQIRSFFWSVFSCIRTRKDSVFGHFSRSEDFGGYTETTTHFSPLL